MECKFLEKIIDNKNKRIKKDEMMPRVNPNQESSSSSNTQSRNQRSAAQSQAAAASRASAMSHITESLKRSMVNRATKGPKFET